MATKDRMDFGDFEFDGELNFDFDENPKRSPLKNRSKPIDHVVDGVKESMRSKFTDPSHLKSMFRKALPDGFGRAWDAVDTVATDAARLYDQSIKEIAPTAGAIARKIDQLTPSGATRAKRFTQNLAERMNSTNLDNRYGYSEASQTDSAVARMLGEFEQSREQSDQTERERDQIREAVSERTEGKRFEANQSVLGVIANSSLALRKYVETYDISFKRKSLELQFRSYAAQASLVNSFARFTENTHTFQQALLVNTSLPEYAKTSDTQRYKDRLKGKTFDKINDSLFGSKSRIGLAGERAITALREKKDGMKDTLEMLDDALGMAIDSKEMGEDMAEMTGKEYSGWNTAGVFGGSMLSDALSDWLSSKVKGLAEKNPALLKKSMDVGQMAVNPGSIIEKLRESKTYKNMGSSESGELMKSGLDLMMSLLGGEKADLTIKNGSVGSEYEDKIHTQVRQARTINEIIPGYLARILREITVLRTGNDKEGLLTFDVTSGRFKSEKSMASDLLASFQKQAKEHRNDRKTYSEEFSDLYKKFTGGEAIDEQAVPEVQSFLQKISRSSGDFSYTEESLKKTKEYGSLSDVGKKAVGDILKKRFSGNDLSTSTNQFRVASAASSLKASIGNLKAPIDKAIKDGYGEILERSGVIRRNDKGNWDIDEDKYYEFFDSGTKDGTIASDFNLKTNITPTNKDPGAALNAFRNTNLYNWDYKKNANSKAGEHLGYAGYTGPMAQDVRSNFGEDTAPGGKTIDLVNMNGHTMAAIKALTEKVDQMGSSESLKYLASIDANTKLMAEKGSFGSGTGAAAGKSGPSGIAGHLGGLITALMQGAGSGAATMADGAMKAGTFIKDASETFWSDNKDSMKDARDSIIRTAIKGARAATDLGIDLLYNKLPSGMQVARKFGAGLMDRAKDALHSAKDLYVAGRSSPAIQGVLLRAGYYRDRATGAVMKTMDDLAKATGDIVNGNNEVVLSAMDRASGLYDSSGIKLKSFLGRGLELGARGLRYANAAVSSLFKGARDFAGSGKLSDIGGAITGGLKKVGGAIGGAAGMVGGRMDERVVPVLIQIRDLLALNKHGKRVKAILNRSLTSSDSPSKAPTNPNEGINENPEIVGNALTTQVRDLLASMAPADAVKDVLNRSRNAASFLKIPMIGEKVKRFMERFTKNGSGGLPGMETHGGGGDSSMPGAKSGDSVMSGLQADPQNPNPNGEKPPSMFERLQGLFGAGRNAAGAFGSAARKQFPNMGKGRRAQQAKGLFGKFKGSRAGQFMGRGLGTVGSALGAAGTIAGAIFGAGSNNPAMTDPSVQTVSDDYSAASHDARLAELKGNDAAKSFKKGDTFADNDGDGQRDGGAADRMKDAAAARLANNERKQASLEKAQRGAEEKANRNRPADDAIEKMIAMATGGLGAIAGMAGNILSGAAGLLGLLGLGGGGKGGKGGILKKGLGLAGGLVGGVAKGVGKVAMGTGRAIGATIGVLGSTGAAVKGALSVVPGSAAAARVGITAVRAAQVVGLAFGGAGGLLAGTLGVLGSILASPVVVGAAAVGAIGYGAYKLTKYLTRNNIDQYERIRAMQYGLDGTDATKMFNSKTFGLENYLLDGRLAFTNGKPKVNERTVDIKEILEMFDINSEDTEMQEKFASWYKNRFQPVFLHHVAILHRINPKVKLSSISDLKPPQMLEYLSSADIDGVWNYTTSPFKGLDVLNDNPKPCRELIASMIQTQGLKVQKEAKRDIKAGADKPKGADAANATRVITSAVPAATSDKLATPALSAEQSASKERKYNPSTPNFKETGGNTGMDRINRNNPAMAVMQGNAPSNVEEGKEPPSVQQGTLSFKGGGPGSSNLKSAGGPLSAGDQGAQFLKMGKDATIEGLQPRMKQHLMGMAQEYGELTGKSIPINEGFRSYQRQAQLYRQYGPGRAAPPGSSLHEYGLALDINTNVMNELEQLGLLRKYGFTRPIRGETWHMEPSGIQSGIQHAKKDGSFADSAIQASLGRGGGGLGSTPNAQKGGRDAVLARSIFESGASGTVKTADAGAGTPALASLAVGKAGADPMIRAAGSSAIESIADSPKGGGSFAKMGADKSVMSSGAAVESAAASLGDGKGKYDGVKADIAKYSAEVGANPNKMMLLAAMESSLDPTKGNGTTSAKGLMQFVDDTWAESAGKHGSKHGINPTNVMDPRAQVILAAKGLEEKNAALRKAAGGRPLSFTDEYLGHMLGRGGARTFIKADPDAMAAKVMPEAAKNNPNVFFENGRPRTIAEVRAYVDSRVKKTASDFGIELPGSDLPVTDQALTPGTSKASTQAPFKNPIGSSEKPALSKGYSVPGGELPSFTKSKDAPTRAIYRPADTSTAERPTGIGPAVRDKSTSLMDDVFVKLTVANNAQLEHLSSIDRTLLDRMVPILQEIATNTAAPKEDTTSKPSEPAKTPLPSRNGEPIMKNSRTVRAGTSVLDNRRPSYAM